MPHSRTDALAITVAQAAIDTFWHHWTGSQDGMIAAKNAAQFWSVQAFGRHGMWVRQAAEIAVDTFIDAHLDHGLAAGIAEDRAVAAAVYQVTGTRLGKTLKS